MNDSEFQRLLNSAAKAAEKHFSLTNAVAAECERRYGVTWSDVDCDAIIDILDHHGASGFELEGFHINMMDSLWRKGLLNDDGAIKRDD